MQIILLGTMTEALGFSLGLVQISALDNEISLAMYSNLLLGNGRNNDIGV